MSQLREYYKKYGDRVTHILREPTEEELVGLMPAFHKLKNPDGSDMNVGQYLDFSKTSWKSKQVRDIIGLLMEEQS